MPSIKKDLIDLRRAFQTRFSVVFHQNVVTQYAQLPQGPYIQLDYWTGVMAPFLSPEEQKELLRVNGRARDNRQVSYVF